MPAQRPSEVLQQAVISVTAMAKAVSLSRARLYELVRKGVFLAPVYSVTTRRPLYTREMIEINVRVRATNVGVNGEYILFYDHRQPSVSPPQRAGHADLVAGLRSLGMSATVAQVESALSALYPKGTGGVADEMVLRAVYRRLRAG